MPNALSGKTVIAIIPARGGSKRLPGKNLRPLAGKPLIVHSIDHARGSRYISRTIVSTDDPAIADTAREAGAGVRMRPAALAQDRTPSLPVFQDVVAQLDVRPDIIVVLQPTSPFRLVPVIDSAIELLADRDADAVIAVTKAKFGPEWLLEVDGDALQMPTREALQRSRTQDQRTRYTINGNLYVYTYETLMGATDYAFGARTLPLILRSPFDHDIDDLTDFHLAEAIAENYDFDR